MRRGYFCLMVFAALYTDEFVPAGLLTFSQEIPIELDAVNREGLQKDAKNQIERNVRAVDEKRFPLVDVSLAFLAVCAFIALRYYPGEKNQEIIAVKTAQDHAGQELEALRAENLSPDIQYERLIAILRSYIEERYGINAPAKTTEEFLEMIRENPDVLPELSREAFQEVLVLSDLIKFAKEKPSPQDCQEAFAIIHKFIDL
jgi:hypothetical protein